MNTARISKYINKQLQVISTVEEASGGGDRE